MKIDVSAWGEWSISKHKPFKVVVSAITLVAFFVNIFAYDLALAYPAAEIQRHASPEKPETTGFKHLDASTFQLPEHIGRICHAHKAGSKKTIIHIQDAHCNYAAQARIADLIGHLNREYGIDTVNLEGGKGDYDLTLFTAVRDRATRERVSDHFMREGLMNGAEWFAINSPDRIRLWGLEDTRLYLDNLNVYRDSLKYKEEAERILKSISHALNSLKPRIYSKELFELDLKYTAYKADNLDFREYLRYLLEKAASKGMDLKDFTDLRLFLEALDLEKEIDFKRANTERDQMIDDLQKEFSKAELEELVLKTVEFKMEKIAQSDFYGYLLKKARAVGLSPERYPELQRYVVYITLYGRVDKSRLMTEADVLEGRLKSALYENSVQRELDKLSKNLALTKNIFNITITRNDYKYYKDNEAAFAAKGYRSFVERYAPLYKVTASLGDDIGRLDSYRERMAQFYEYSFKRDDVFIKNMRFANSADSETAVIVTGGFHTERLRELAEERNISYISIMPEFKNPEGYRCPYFELLAGRPNGLISRISSSLFSNIMLASFLSDPELSEGAHGKAFTTSFRLLKELEALDSGHDGIVFRLNNGRSIALNRNGVVVNEGDLKNAKGCDVKDIIRAQQPALEERAWIRPEDRMLLTKIPAFIQQHFLVKRLMARREEKRIIFSQIYLNLKNGRFRIVGDDKDRDVGLFKIDKRKAFVTTGLYPCAAIIYYGRSPKGLFVYPLHSPITIAEFGEMNRMVVNKFRENGVAAIEVMVIPGIDDSADTVAKEIKMSGMLKETAISNVRVCDTPPKSIGHGIERMAEVEFDNQRAKITVTDYVKRFLLPVRVKTYSVGIRKAAQVPTEDITRLPHAAIQKPPAPGGPALTTASSSFAENPRLSSLGMNALVAAVDNAALQGFLLRRIPPTSEWKLRASARRASFDLLPNLATLVVFYCLVYVITGSSTFAVIAGLIDFTLSVFVHEASHIGMAKFLDAEEVRLAFRGWLPQTAVSWGKVIPGPAKIAFYRIAGNAGQLYAGMAGLSVFAIRTLPYSEFGLFLLAFSMRNLLAGFISFVPFSIPLVPGGRDRDATVFWKIASSQRYRGHLEDTLIRQAKKFAEEGRGLDGDISELSRTNNIGELTRIAASEPRNRARQAITGIEYVLIKKGEKTAYSEAAGAIADIAIKSYDRELARFCAVTLGDLLKRKGIDWEGHHAIGDGMAKIAAEIAYEDQARQAIDCLGSVFLKNGLFNSAYEAAAASLARIARTATDKTRAEYCIMTLEKVLAVEGLGHWNHTAAVRAVNAIARSNPQSIKPSLIPLLLKLFTTQDQTFDILDVIGETVTNITVNTEDAELERLCVTAFGGILTRKGLSLQTYGAADNVIINIYKVKPRLIEPSLLADVVTALPEDILFYDRGDNLVPIVIEKSPSLITPEIVSRLAKRLRDTSAVKQPMLIIKAIIKIAAKTPDKELAALCVTSMEDILSQEGLRKKVGSWAHIVLAGIKMERPELIRPASVADVALSLSERVAGHSIPCWRFYLSDDFRNMTKEMGQEERYSVAVAGYHLLRQLKIEESQVNIAKAADYIMGKRREKEIVEKEVFAKGRPVINIFHEDFWGSELRLLRELEADIADIEPHDMRMFKGPHGKRRALRKISAARGPLTVFFGGHGIPTDLQLGRNRFDPLTLFGLKETTISYKELGDALMRRGSLDKVVIMLNSCYSYNFAVNLSNYLAASGAKELPTIIATANYEKPSHGNVAIKSLISVKAGSKGPVTVGNVFKAEKFALDEDDFAIFVPLNVKELEKRFGKEVVEKALGGTAVIDRETGEWRAPVSALELGSATSGIRPDHPGRFPTSMLEVGFHGTRKRVTTGDLETLARPADIAIEELASETVESILPIKAEKGRLAIKDGAKVVIGGKTITVKTDGKFNGLAGRSDDGKVVFVNEERINDLLKQEDTLLARRVAERIIIHDLAEACALQNRVAEADAHTAGLLAEAMHPGNSEAVRAVLKEVLAERDRHDFVMEEERSPAVAGGKSVDIDTVYKGFKGPMRVGMGCYRVEELSIPLFTDGIADCAALLIIDRTTGRHFLGHVSPSTRRDEIKNTLVREGLNLQDVLTDIYIMKGYWSPGTDKTAAKIRKALSEDLGVAPERIIDADYKGRDRARGIASHNGKLYLPPTSLSVFLRDAAVAIGTTAAVGFSLSWFFDPALSILIGILAGLAADIVVILKGRVRYGEGAYSYTGKPFFEHAAPASDEVWRPSDLKTIRDAIIKGGPELPKVLEATGTKVVDTGNGRKLYIPRGFMGHAVKGVMSDLQFFYDVEVGTFCGARILPNRDMLLEELHDPEPRRILALRERWEGDSEVGSHPLWKMIEAARKGNILSGWWWLGRFKLRDRRFLMKSLTPNFLQLRGIRDISSLTPAQLRKFIKKLVDTKWEAAAYHTACLMSDEHCEKVVREICDNGLTVVQAHTHPPDDTPRPQIPQVSYGDLLSSAAYWLGWEICPQIIFTEDAALLVIARDEGYRNGRFLCSVDRIAITPKEVKSHGEREFVEVAPRDAPHWVVRKAVGRMIHEKYKADELVHYKDSYHYVNRIDLLTAIAWLGESIVPERVVRLYEIIRGRFGSLIIRLARFRIVIAIIACVAEIMIPARKEIKVSRVYKGFKRLRSTSTDHYRIGRLGVPIITSNLRFSASLVIIDRKNDRHFVGNIANMTTEEQIKKALESEGLDLKDPTTDIYIIRKDAISTLERNEDRIHEVLLNMGISDDKIVFANYRGKGSVPAVVSYNGKLYLPGTEFANFAVGATLSAVIQAVAWFGLSYLIDIRACVLIGAAAAVAVLVIIKKMDITEHEGGIYGRSGRPFSDIRSDREKVNAESLDLPKGEFHSINWLSKITRRLDFIITVVHETGHIIIYIILHPFAGWRNLTRDRLMRAYNERIFNVPPAHANYITVVLGRVGGPALAMFIASLFLYLGVNSWSLPVPLALAISAPLFAISACLLLFDGIGEPLLSVLLKKKESDWNMAMSISSFDNRFVRAVIASGIAYLFWRLGHANLPLLFSGEASILATFAAVSSIFITPAAVVDVIYSLKKRTPFERFDDLIRKRMKARMRNSFSLGGKHKTDRNAELDDAIAVFKALLKAKGDAMNMGERAQLRLTRGQIVKRLKRHWFRGTTLYRVADAIEDGGALTAHDGDISKARLTISRKMAEDYKDLKESEGKEGIVLEFDFSKDLSAPFTYLTNPLSSGGLSGYTFLPLKWLAYRSKVEIVRRLRGISPVKIASALGLTTKQVMEIRQGKVSRVHPGSILGPERAISAPWWEELTRLVPYYLGGTWAMMAGSIAYIIAHIFNIKGYRERFPDRGVLSGVFLVPLIITSINTAFLLANGYFGLNISFMHAYIVTTLTHFVINIFTIYDFREKRFKDIGEMTLLPGSIGGGANGQAGRASATGSAAEQKIEASKEMTVKAKVEAELGKAFKNLHGGFYANEGFLPVITESLVNALQVDGGNLDAAKPIEIVNMPTVAEKRDNLIFAASFKTGAKRKYIIDISPNGSKNRERVAIWNIARHAVKVHQPTVLIPPLYKHRTLTFDRYELVMWPYMENPQRLYFSFLSNMHDLASQQMLAYQLGRTASLCGWVLNDRHLHNFAFVPVETQKAGQKLGYVVSLDLEFMPMAAYFGQRERTFPYSLDFLEMQSVNLAENIAREYFVITEQTGMAYGHLSKLPAWMSKEERRLLVDSFFTGFQDGRFALQYGLRDENRLREIIGVALGGSATEDNVRLYAEKANRFLSAGTNKLTKEVADHLGDRAAYHDNWRGISLREESPRLLSSYGEIDRYEGGAKGSEKFWETYNFRYLTGLQTAYDSLGRRPFGGIELPSKSETAQPGSILGPERAISAPWWEELTRLVPYYLGGTWAMMAGSIAYIIAHIFNIKGYRERFPDRGVLSGVFLVPLIITSINTAFLLANGYFGLNISFMHAYIVTTLTHFVINIFTIYDFREKRFKDIGEMTLLPGTVLGGRSWQTAEISRIKGEIHNVATAIDALCDSLYEKIKQEYPDIARFPVKLNTYFTKSDFDSALKWLGYVKDIVRRHCQWHHRIDFSFIEAGERELAELEDRYRQLCHSRDTSPALIREIASQRAEISEKIRQELGRLGGGVIHIFVERGAPARGADGRAMLIAEALARASGHIEVYLYIEKGAVNTRFDMPTGLPNLKVKDLGQEPLSDLMKSVAGPKVLATGGAKSVYEQFADVVAKPFAFAYEDESTHYLTNVGKHIATVNLANPYGVLMLDKGLAARAAAKDGSWTEETIIVKRKEWLERLSAQEELRQALRSPLDREGFGRDRRTWLSALKELGKNEGWSPERCAWSWGYIQNGENFLKEMSMLAKAVKDPKCKWLERYSIPGGRQIIIHLTPGTRVLPASLFEPLRSLGCKVVLCDGDVLNPEKAAEAVPITVVIHTSIPNQELKTLAAELSGTLKTFERSGKRMWVNLPAYLTGSASWLEAISCGAPYLHDDVDTGSALKHDQIVSTIIRMLALRDSTAPNPRTWNELTKDAADMAEDFLMGREHAAAYSDLEAWAALGREYSEAMFKFNLVDDILAAVAARKKAVVRESAAGQISHKFVRLPGNFNNGALDGELRSVENEIRANNAPWVKEIIVEHSRFGERSGPHIVGSRLHLIISAAKPKLAKPQIQNMISAIRQEIETAKAEGRTSSVLDADMARTILTQQMWPWMRSIPQLLKESPSHSNDKLPDALLNGWSAICAKLKDSASGFTSPSAGIKTWGDMHKALYSLNETFAMPAGYVVTNTGSIVMLDRHRVKEFLGARYHSVEGEVLKENGVEYGLEKYPLCWGLIAIVFPSQIGTQVKTRIGYYKELARKYQWSLEDSLRRAVKSLREDEKWEIEYAEIIDEMVPTLVKEMENLRADRERTFLYQKTVEEEEFHARQNIAAALLTKRDVELLGSLQVSAALLRPDGMIASRDFLPSLAEHQNALQNDIAVSSIMESMYDFYELRHTDNPLYSIAEHLILVFMEIWTNKNAADEDALKRINRVSSQTTLYYLCRFLALLKKDKDIASLIKSADSRQLTQFTKEASESCLASNFYRWEEIEDLSKIGKFERAARLLSGFSPDERDERLRNATFTELVAFQSGLTPLEVKTVGVAAALADRRSAAGEGKPPAATQKPYSSEGLELAEIKARIGQQKPTRLSKDELVSLFGSLKPGTQTETTEFNLAFPDFRRQFEDISNILARAPPHIEVYQLERSLEDKDKLPVSAISYREDGTLKIFITPNNAPGLFHELYEHEILKGSSYDRTRHTLAAVAEGAFSDSILSQRAVGQLAEMAKRDKNLLEKFIATYNTAIDGEDSIIDQINEKFPDSPDLQGLRSYILAHAKAMHEEALKIREINAGIEAIVNECYDERAVEIRGRYGLSTDAVLVKKLEELFKQCLPGAAFDFHKYLSSDSHFHKFYTTYCQTKESTRRALLRLWSIYRKYHRIVNLVNERLERHVGTDGPALEAIEFLVEGERSPMRCIQPTGFNPVTKLGINVESMFDESNDIFGIGDVAHEAGHALLKLVDNLGSLLEEDAEMAANWVAGQILDQREIEGYLANKVKVHFKFERGSIYCHTAAFLLAFARKAGIREDPPIIQELLRQAPSGLAAAYSRYYDALRWRSGQAAAKGRMGSDYSQAGAEIKTGDRNALLGIVLENPANYSIVDSTDTDECNAKAAEALAMLKRLAIVEKDLAAIIIEDTAATKGIVSEYDSLIVGGKTTAVTRFGQLAIMSRKYAAGNSIIDIALSIAHEDAASRKKQGQEAANAATAEKGPSGVGESFVIEACAAEFQHAAGCTAEARFLKRLGLKGAKALGIDRKAYEDLLRIKESGRIGAETVARVKNDAAESIWKRVSDGGLRESMKTVTGREYTASEWKTLARDLADVKTDYDACKAFGLDVKLKKQLSMMAQDMRRMIQEKKARGDKTFTLFAAGLGHEPLELITLLSTFYSELVLQEDEDPKEWDVRVYAVDAQKGPISNARRYFDNEGAVLNLTELDYGTGLGVEKKGTILLSRLKKLERFNIKYAAANVLDENAFDGSRPLFGEEAAPVSKTDYVVMRHVYYFDNYFNKRHATKDMGFMNNLTSADSAKSLEAAKSLLQYHTALRNLFYLARPTDSKTPTRLVIEPLERIIMNQRDYFPILLPPGTTATQHWGSGILEINDSAAISDIAAFHRSLRDDYLRERHAEFVQKVTESVAEAAKPPIADETPLYETLLKLLKNVRAPAKPRVFFIPVKDPAAREFHDARNALRRGFEKEDFKNVAMVFYDGTEEDLIRTYERERATPDAELNMPGTLALAYADSDRISGEALEAHNRSNPTFKWVREDLPEGVLRKDLFMHVAFGLSVLDYLANDADPEHREKLINLIEKMVANDAKEIVHIFTSKFVLKLKKIERINMEEKLKQHEMSIAKVLTAA